ncbi:murein biosynthesis integral membrane protein MurJ [Candidatus Saccharibacteria bacterium]|nr:murein biosynthesis integral membrane protein MurJ [Candidatus Saccharibacteria bacterium]
MNRFLKRANKKLGVSGAATLLLIISLVGQVLGFLRYKIVNANFPIVGPQSTDAYFAAFKIPDFFFYTLAAGALGVAFIPILSEHLEKGDRRGVWDLTNSLLNLLVIVMAIVGTVMFLFADQLIRYIVAPNLPPEQIHNAATIMRLISFNPLLFTISGILAGAQQAFGRFFFFAIGPIFYNVAIMMSVYVFKDNVGLVGLGVGALIGAILQLIVVCFGLINANFRWRPKILWRSRDFRSILRLLPARSIDQGVDSINSIAETNFATRLGVGSVSYYENAYIMHTTPILLIGTAISTAAFPKLTERLAQGRSDLFRKEFLQVLRAIIWITLPIAVVCYFARGYFARLIFTNSAPEIAVVFGYFAVAILFRSIYAMISRWFYAQKDTATPLFVSLAAIALNIVLAYFLAKPYNYGIVGLAIAQSIVAAVEVVILSAVMVLRDHKLLDKDFWIACLKMLSVTGFAVMTAFLMISVLPLQIADKGFITLGMKLSTITGVTALVYLVVSWIFDLDEAKSVFKYIKKLIYKPLKVNV